MRLSKYLMPTLREVPAEAEIVSHQLMLRAGIMRKLASGVYSYLPMGLRSLKKVENIIREEMDKQDAIEVLMSALLPAESYQASGRWDVFGQSMFRLKDRSNRDFCLGPTHEEIFTETVKATIKSYKQLPVTLYQIQTKYRDEARPRFGVIRSREFIMKDAYSFDKDEKGLDESYQKMYKAYRSAFDRLDMDYMVVDADSGAMGGSGSQEFMVKSEIGEDSIAFCDACNYCANIEKAVCVSDENISKEELKEIAKVHTPNAGTIEELVAFLGTTADKFAKTLIYKAEDKLVAVMVRGDREVNEVKLANYLGATEVELAPASDVCEVTNARVGFAGPVGLKIDVICDSEVANMQNFVVGANESDYHYTNVNIDRDFTPSHIGDFRNIEKGDKCPVCGKPIDICKGIEVGHIFKLGTKYSKALDCTFLDENGKAQVPIMGCYGIGVSRCVAAIVEEHSDEKGIIWPMNIAPYHVNIVCANMKDEDAVKISEELYNKFLENGVEVIYDDRNERAGVKFNDADLIGIPIRITVGKKAKEGIVEYKLRCSDEISEVSADDVVKMAMDEIKDKLN